MSRGLLGGKLSSLDRKRDLGVVCDFIGLIVKKVGEVYVDKSTDSKSREELRKGMSYQQTSKCELIRRFGGLFPVFPGGAMLL